MSLKGRMRHSRVVLAQWLYWNRRKWLFWRLRRAEKKLHHLMAVANERGYTGTVSPREAQDYLRGRAPR